MSGDPSDLTEVLRVAHEAVEDAGIPEPLQASAFERILDVLLARAGVVDLGTGQSPRPETGGGTALAPSGASDGGGLAQIADRASVSVEEIKQVYKVDGDKLSVVVGNRKINSTAAQGSRELTLLVAAGRQSAGFEEWTALSHARDTCNNYSRLDSNNYASTILSMDDEFAFHGQGVDREVRVTMPGWEAWQELVQRLVRNDE